MKTKGTGLFSFILIFIFTIVIDQIKVASKTFTLSRQMGGESWKMDYVTVTL